MNNDYASIKNLSENILSKRERYFLDQYFIHSHTLHEIGSEYNITPQAVSININKSLKKLRRHIK